MSALSLVAVLGITETASAQGGWHNDHKQQRKISKQQEKIERQRAKMEQERQAQWNRQNNGVYNNGNMNNRRYRVYRNGAYYNTDNRGAELLRQAVNEGYRQGFIAGRNDRNGRRRGNWSNSNVYQSGTYGYKSHVDRGQYQYYFRQGFQRGYQDGSNSRYQKQNDYNGQYQNQNGYNDEQYQYGSNQNGSMNILGTILSQILNIQSY